jgi:hypothetical protein
MLIEQIKNIEFNLCGRRGLVRCPSAGRKTQIIERLGCRKKLQSGGLI